MTAPMLINLAREAREIGSREEWLGWRTHDYPCSVLGALFGAHDFVTLSDVLARMRGHREPQTRAQRAGLLLQKLVPDLVAEEKPDWRIDEATTYHRLPDRRLGGTPDFFVYSRQAGDGILEAKTINERSWEAHHGTPPLYWNLQLQGYLLLTGLQWGAIAVIIRNSDLPLYLFEVQEHPAAQERLLAAVADFWRAFDAGEFPVAAPSEELAAMLDDGSHVDLSGDNRLPEWLEKREVFHAQRTAADKEIKAIDHQVKQRMGSASTAWLPGWEISLRLIHRKEFVTPAKDIPTLRIKRTEGKEISDDNA